MVAGVPAQHLGGTRHVQASLLGGAPARAAGRARAERGRGSPATPPRSCSCATPASCRPPDVDPEAVTSLRAGLRARREVRATLRNQRPDGTGWWNEMHLVPIRDADDVVTHWIATQDDVTDRIEAERQVAYLAHHDTGDRLLVAIAHRLRDHVRIGDLLVRQGGDEFLLVLAGLPGPLRPPRGPAGRPPTSSAPSCARRSTWTGPPDP